MILQRLITCKDSIEAHIIQGMLESNNIPSVLSHENFNDLMPNYYNIMGSGVDIHVDEKDFEHAQKLIQETKTEEDVLCCPHCKSTNYKVTLGPDKIRKIITIILSAFSGVPLGNINTEYQCQECKTTFRP